MSDSAAARRQRRPSTSDARFVEIVDIAAGVFQTLGYGNARIQDVADAVGILKGSLYYYIESKEDLLFAIVNDVQQMAIDLMVRTKLAAGDPPEQLRFFIREHIRISVEHHVKISVSLSDFEALDLERRSVIRRDRDIFTAYLVSIVRTGQDRGDFDSTLDPVLATYGIVGLLNWTSTWFRLQGVTTPEELASTYESLLLSGLTPRQ